MHVRANASFACGFLFLFLLTSLTGAPASALAAEIPYHDSWAEHGLTVTSQSPTGLEFSFSLAKWHLVDVEINGQPMQAIQVPGMLLPNDEGAPNLPGTGRYIAVPNGGVATVRIVGSRTEILPGIELAPAPRIPKETESGPLHYQKNPQIYTRNAYYPADHVLLSAPTEIRGVGAVLLGITPFQYNPVTKELLVYRDLRLEVTFSGGDGRFGQDRLRNRWWDPILADVLLNYSSLPAVDYNLHSESRTEDFEYVIICPDDPVFTAYADSLRVFRNAQGIRTGVVTTTEVGGNTTAAIEAYVDNAYNTWTVPPSAVLLLGDYGTGSSGIISPIYDSYCLSDNIYADVNGDHLPDIAFARMCAENETHLATLVGKALGYERQPPVNAGYYSNPVVAGGWQTERWFILCDEVLYGFMANELGKTPVREYAIYSGTPGSTWSTATNTSTVVSYFGPGGLGYIPADPSHLTDWGASATRLNNDLNSGAFILQHRDHGGNDGWGEPDYDSGDLAGLSNSDLTFVFSINCLTGEYNIPGECFAETFHRHTQGALGIIAASESSYSFVNDTYVWGMYDYMWPDFDPGYGTTGPHDMKPAFANASGKYYLQASNWPYNTSSKEVTHHLFHHHGDAFTTVYTEMPQALTVAHDGAMLSGVPFFNVTADAGALIGLSVDGEWLGSALGTGGPLSIDIPPQMPGGTLLVTVTMQNYYRYSQSVPIIPPEGPYVVFESYAINDVSGNGNGLLDYREDVLLSLTLQNVGLEASTKVDAVIATAGDLYTTIIDASEKFPDIPAASSATVVDAYEIVVASTVPDEHVIPFTVTTTDNDSTYVSYFSITAHAPDLVMDNYFVDDGGDNILDPGETADLQVTLLNDGSSQVANLNITLTSLNPNVTVNVGSANIPSLAPDESGVATFNLSAAPETPIGEVAEFDLVVDATDYTYQTTLAMPIGLSIEDFENGHFMSYPWTMAGDADWTIDTAAPYEGVYCARSGDVSDNQTSELSVDTEVLADGTISFWYKVSSESSYDYLRFSIDGSEMGSWSGSVGWAEVSYPVTTGLRTFTWKYTKDGSVSTGSDCGWIDYIIFPAIGEPPLPLCEVSPLSFEVTILPEDTLSQTITVTNDGEGELDYEVILTVDDEAARDIPAVNFKKGEPDPRQGSAPSEGSGGPDPFGYVWIDSAEPGGPTYDWVEINGVGTAVGTDDDANYGPFSLGFDFSFYGITYNQVRICTNGWISFTSTSTRYTNDPIPAGGDPNTLVAPFWDDLDPGSGGLIYYWADIANQRFIVEYDGVHHYPSGNPETFQVIIYADGTLAYQYKTADLTGGCTVGIENSTGSVGLQVVYNAAYLHSNLAIRLAAEPLPEPWVSVSPLEGTVGPLSSDELTVRFCSSDVEIGDYTGTITINTNDPSLPVIAIPVILHVDGLSAVDETLPSIFALGAAYPNPFNPSVNIEFAIPHPCRATLSVYDVAGRLVRTLFSGKIPAGRHVASWDGRDDHGRQAASGTYYYRLDAGKFSDTQQAVLIK